MRYNVQQASDGSWFVFDGEVGWFVAYGLNHEDTAREICKRAQELETAYYEAQAQMAADIAAGRD